MEVAPLLAPSELLLRLPMPSRARVDPARHLGLFQQLQLAQLGLLVGVAPPEEPRALLTGWPFGPSRQILGYPLVGACLALGFCGVVAQRMVDARAALFGMDDPNAAAVLARHLANWAPDSMSELLEDAAGDVPPADLWLTAKGVRICGNYLGPVWLCPDWLR